MQYFASWLCRPWKDYFVATYLYLSLLFGGMITMVGMHISLFDSYVCLTICDKIMTYVMSVFYQQRRPFFGK